MLKLFTFLLLIPSALCAQGDDLLGFLEIKFVNCSNQIRFDLETMIHEPSKRTAQNLRVTVDKYEECAKELGIFNQKIMAASSQDSIEYEIFLEVDKWVKNFDLVTLKNKTEKLVFSDCFYFTIDCKFIENVEEFIKAYNGNHMTQILQMNEIVMKYHWLIGNNTKRVSRYLVEYPFNKLPNEDYTSLVDYFIKSDKKYAKESLNKSNEEFFQFTRNKAEKEKADYMARLGLFYFLGFGVKKNDELAYTWIQKACDKKHTSSHLLLGYMAENGIGLKKDSDLAMYAYTYAAEKDIVPAMTRIAILHMNAPEESRDFYEIRKWLKLAKQMNDPDAAFHLGLIANSGFGVKRDFSSAKSYFEEAAMEGNSFAMLYLWDYYYHAKGVNKDDWKAKMWLEKAVEAQNKDAIFTQGALYWQGQMYDQDSVLGYQKIIQAADLDQPTAQWHIGSMLIHGIQGQKDEKKAFSYLLKSREHDNLNAKVLIAELYEKGIGIEKNMAEARKIYHEVKDLHPHAEFRLGILNLEQEGAEKNLALAHQYFESAAQRFHTGSMIMLGFMYWDGLWVNENLEQAIAWFKRAASLNNPLARILLLACEIEAKVDLNDLQKALELTAQIEELGLTMNEELFEEFWNILLDDQEIDAFSASPKSLDFEKIVADAENGDTKAMVLLGDFLSRSRDTQDKSHAHNWYEKAAALDNAEAAFKTGLSYYFGFDGSGKREFKKAREWFVVAANKNNADAMFMLGELYYSGLGVKMDYSLAMKWYKKAAQLGNSEAMLAIGLMYLYGESVPKSCSEARKWYLKALHHGNKGAQKRLDNLPCR